MHTDPATPILPRRLSGQQRAAFAALSIHRSLQERVDVARIGRELNVSRRQLERDFRRWLNVGPIEYARLQRFEAASRALKRGAPIVDVACDFGYADQSHFTRVTRKVCGLTPRTLQAALAPETG